MTRYVKPYDDITEIRAGLQHDWCRAKVLGPTCLGLPFLGIYGLPLRAIGIVIEWERDAIKDIF